MKRKNTLEAEGHLVEDQATSGGCCYISNQQEVVMRFEAYRFSGFIKISNCNSRISVVKNGKSQHEIVNCLNKKINRIKRG